MTETFQARIPTLSDAELHRYLARHLAFKVEAVEAVLAELERRGQGLSPEERARIRSALDHREAALRAEARPWFDGLLGRGTARRSARVRLATLAILLAGLGAALAIYLGARPEGPNPLGYDPLDTKKHLRDLELYGGRANVVATQFMRWFDGLWQGRRLAGTVAWLTGALALGFWSVARRHVQEPEAPAGSGKDD